MSYLSLVGQVAGIYESPKGVNRETGEEYGGSHYVQMLCDEQMRNGEHKLSLFTLRTDSPHLFEPHRGGSVSVPVGVYVRNGAVAFYLAKGNRPVPWEAAEAA
jgi:hypothetical protein